jgi:CrcB protein
MWRLFLIGLGGALGTLARYGVSIGCQQRFGAAFPYGTLTVNVVGSFFLGAIMHVGLTTDLLSPTMRLALGTGVMGGFTTYSTFNYETLKLFQEGAWLTGIANVLVTLLGGLTAGLLGSLAARKLLGV